MAETPAGILALATEEVFANLGNTFISNKEIAEAVDFVSRNIQNRAGVRLLLSCALAKTHNSKVDARKPYTEIGDADAFSGRTLDEHVLGPFINKYQLPCNPTTAFLTPALRNRNIILTPGVNLVGRPPELYQTVLNLLTAMQSGQVESRAVLLECLRTLFVVKNEKEQRMSTLLAGLRTTKQGSLPLSTEAIVTLIQQHLNCKGASRLPVLVVAAAYTAAERCLGEIAKPLRAHNAADLQTGAFGDIEITLINDEKVVTTYEMKTRRVTREDIAYALNKIDQSGSRVDNYIFITTDFIAVDVAEYAASLYQKTGGTEFVILDCISFLRHYLHLFHRLRQDFLDWYQEFVLAESDSAVRSELKEAFLALRSAAESETTTE